MENFITFLNLLQHRKKVMSFDEIEWSLLERVNQLHATMTQAKYEIKGEDINGLMECWEILSSFGKWELSLVGILVVLDVLKADAANTYFSISPTAVINNVKCHIYNMLVKEVVNAESRVRTSTTSLIQLLSILPWIDPRELFANIGGILWQRLHANVQREDDQFQSIFCIGIVPPTMLQLDDTTGWRDLESSLCSLHAMILGFRSKTRFDFFGICSVEYCDMLFSALPSHINRHIRQRSIEFIGSFAKTFLYEEADAATHTYDCNSFQEVDCCRRCLVQKCKKSMGQSIGLGLDDSWSQIRLISLATAKSFLATLSSADQEGYYDLLLPRLCLNRFFTSAPGVENAAIDVWREVVEDRGKLLLAAHISSTATHYISMTKSKNHEISEAAFHAIAELVIRIDREAVQTTVPLLADAVFACIQDPSWPVRDAAVVASGHLVSHFPLECAYGVTIYLDALCRNMKDAIWSVRENAAVALGMGASSIYDEATKQICVERCTVHLDACLSAAVDAESNLDQVKRNFLPDQMLAPRNPNVVDVPPKSAWRKGGGWGCCLDCMVERTALPWEISEGAVCLLVEYSSACPVGAARYLSTLCNLLRLHRLKGSEKLQLSILKKLPILLANCANAPESAVALEEVRCQVRRLCDSEKLEIKQEAESVMCLLFHT